MTGRRTLRLGRQSAGAGRVEEQQRLEKPVSANKPLKVKISGVMQGDKFIVSSIH